MPDEPTRAELEARLQSTAEAMNERFDAIQGEIVSTRETVRTGLAKNPLLSVGGAIVAGVAVGWLLGGSKRRRTQNRHRQLVSSYLDAVRDEVRASMGDGEDVESAVRGALQERVPIVVYENSTSDSSGGLLRETFEIIARTALSMLARDVVESVIANSNIDEAIDENLFS